VKQVIFKRLRVQNFLSVGNNVLDLSFNNGINIITGINYDKNSKNGVGKTTILNALNFALFGNTVNNLKKDEIVNNINKGNCAVEVQFDIIENDNTDEYILTRCIEPTKIELLRNGNNITESSIVKTTEQICKLLNTTPEVFTNTVLLTIKNTIPFLAQKKVEKRKFIEGILCLNIFSEMLLQARQEYNDTNHLLDIEKTKYNELEKTHKVYLNQQSEQIKQKEENLQILQSRQNNNSSEIEKLKNTIKSINKSQIEEYKKLTTDVRIKENNESNNIKQLLVNITTNELQKEQFTNRIIEIDKFGSVCELCKRPFQEHDQQTLQNEKDNIRKHIFNITNVITDDKMKLENAEKLQKKYANVIDLCTKQINNITNIIKDNKNIKDQIEQLKLYNEQIIKDIEQLNNTSTNFDNFINDSKTRLDTLINSIQDIEKKLEIINSVKFVVSEEGVKSYIVKKILKVLNTKLQYYLKKFDSNCICTFNEYFEETMTNEQGQKCSYYNFSSGEQRRIDLAILFTFMDIRRIQSGTYINISFYDEVLDSSLDLVGIESFLDILKERVEKYSENVYIITHQTSAIKKLNEMNPNIITLEKRQGFTYIL